MAKLASRFDATAHDTEQRDYEELPNGDYELEIEASEVKEGANGTGLKTTMTVLRPEEYKGRKVFNFYNLEHKNAQAQEIGQRQFASLLPSDRRLGSRGFRRTALQGVYGKDRPRQAFEGRPISGARRDQKILLPR